MFVLSLIPCDMSPDLKADLNARMRACKQVYNIMVSQVNKAIRDNLDLFKDFLNRKIKSYELMRSLTVDYDYHGKEKYFGVTDFAMECLKDDLIKNDMGDGNKSFNKIITTLNGKRVAKSLVTATELLINDWRRKKTAEIREKMKNNEDVPELSFKDLPQLHFKKECNIITFPSSTSNGERIFCGLNLNKSNSTIDVVKGRKKIGIAKYHINKSEKHPYDVYALKQCVKEISFVKKKIRGTEKFYVNFTIEGTPYMKGVTLGKGTVGVDVGPKNVYALSRSEDGQYSETTVNLDTSRNIDKDVAKLQRKIDRSRRSTTPENYNEDGTSKKKGDRVPFRESNRNKENLRKLAELRRKQSAIKEIDEYRTVNQLVTLGDDFRVEKVSVKSWTARKSESHVKKNGKNSSKKRYGKSVSKGAPARFIGKLERKAKLLGGSVTEVPGKWGCTGFDHTDGSYTKHGVGERTVTLSNGNKHNRDFHSCFNAMYAVTGDNVEPKTFNVEKMKEEYPNFCKADLQD